MNNVNNMSLRLGFAVGIGLIVSSAGTFRFFRAINRWVSMRTVVKPLEIPRDADRFAHKYRRRVGVCLMRNMPTSGFHPGV